MLKGFKALDCQMEVSFKDTVFWFFLHSGQDTVPLVYKALEVVVDHLDGHKVFKTIDCAMLDACRKVLMKAKEQMPSLHILVFTSTQLLEGSNLTTKVPHSAISQAC